MIPRLFSFGFDSPRGRRRRRHRSTRAAPELLLGSSSVAQQPGRTGWGRGKVVLAGVGLVTLFGCAGPNLWTDLSSVSTGKSNDGYVRKPARMQSRGRGWVIPSKWKGRKFHYGTDELVAAIERAARRVRAGHRRATLGVADISRLTGGGSPWHSSHHSGRDVDLLFYTMNEKGRPMSPPEHDMIRFDADGMPFLGKDREDYPDEDWEQRRFDTARNWQLLEAFLTDPSVRVQWVFVSDGLRARLLRHAHKAKRPKWLLAYARTVMRQPGDSAPHDDHFHIRVFCTRSDRFHGCRDRGPIWQHEKKTYKYFGPERYDPVTWRLMLGTPFPLL